MSPKSLPERTATRVVVQVYRNGEPDGFPVRTDAISANAEGFTLAFEPELRWFSWKQGYTFRTGDA